MGMLKVIKIIVKILKPLVKILIKLGILNADSLSGLAGLIPDAE